MNEMMERMTRAIFASADDRWCDWPTPDHPECVRMALAAIRAIREPTDAMVTAGNVMVYSDDMACGINALGCDSSGETSTECWRAMIDEALR